MDSKEFCRRFSARVAYLDSIIPSREKELDDLKKERDAITNVMPFTPNILDDVSSGAATPAKPARRQRRRPGEPPRRPTGLETNAGRALHVLDNAAHGLTVDELIESSAETGKPFLKQSITSVLSQLLKNKWIKKVGNRYVSLN